MLVEGKLVEGLKFSCPVCVKGGHDDPVVEKEVVLAEASKLQCVHKFCYLGDMLGFGCGAGDAVRSRVRCAWRKFRELAPILMVRGVSLKMKGKIYSSCVQSTMEYGSETCQRDATAG